MNKLRQLMGFLLFVFSINMFSVYGMHPEVPMNFEQRVKYHGYPVEIHTVTTEDDYINNIYRVPRGKDEAIGANKNKSAVMIVHGMGGSPHNFIALGGREALPFYLADRGFDVWLFCSRGVDCQNPKKHKVYNWDKDAKYWDYSLHEIGLYDQTAAVDYILNVTGQKALFYIGHSAGGPRAYAMLSERPQYNEKLKMFVNYGSGAILRRMDYPLLQLSCMLSTLLKNVARMIGLYEVAAPGLTEVFTSFARVFCADPKTKRMCKVSLWCVGSHKSILMEDEIIEVIVSNIPRVGIKQLTHFMDNGNTGDFRKYDYGPKKNMKLYGQKIPPKYNISACTVPTAFFYGSTDGLNTKEDVWETQDYLTNIIHDEKVGPKFTHLDFLFARNASHMVYEPTVQLFKAFDENRLPKEAKRTKRTDDDDD